MAGIPPAFGKVHFGAWIDEVILVSLSLLGEAYHGYKVLMRSSGYRYERQRAVEWFERRMRSLAHKHELCFVMAGGGSASASGSCKGKFTIGKSRFKVRGNKRIGPFPGYLAPPGEMRLSTYYSNWSMLAPDGGIFDAALW